MGGSEDGFFEDERRFDLLVAVAEVEAVGVGALDLGADADGGDGVGAGPVLDGETEALADATAAGGVADDEAADVDDVGSLEVALDRGIDPRDELVVEKGGEDDVCRRAGEGFNAGAEFGGGRGVAELVAELGGGGRVVGGDGADGEAGGIERHGDIVARCRPHGRRKRECAASCYLSAEMGNLGSVG